MRRTRLTLCALSLLLAFDLSAQRKDPLTTFAFGLQLEGGDMLAGTAFFKSVEGLSTETEVVDYQEGGATGFTRKIPGRLKVSDITLKRGLTSDSSLWGWRKLVEDGAVQQARRNGTLILVDQANKEVARWTLLNVWPSKLSVEIDEESGDPMEILVLAVESIRRK